MYAMFGFENELAPPVMEWAGLLDSDPWLGRAVASDLNDGDGVRSHTFPELADLIEEQL